MIEIQDNIWDYDFVKQEQAEYTVQIVGKFSFLVSYWYDTIKYAIITILVVRGAAFYLWDHLGPTDGVYTNVQQKHVARKRD